MARSPRPTKRDDGGPVRSLATCSACGKQSYRSRGAARKAARTVHPGHHLGAYACPHGNGFHIGHLNPQVIKGKKGRAEVYGRRRGDEEGTA